jgi:predicted nuclease with RNAse H fold
VQRAATAGADRRAGVDADLFTRQSIGKWLALIALMVMCCDPLAIALTAAARGSREAGAMKMSEWWPTMTWFGADPGGVDNFGVAALREDGTYDTKCVSCADDAMNWVRSLGRPNGVGIDCPLWWSSGRGGGRKADQWIRDQGIPQGTAQSANSLQGAALVQGVMFAVRVRERYRGALITETHPKAVLRFLHLPLDLDKWDEVQEYFKLKGSAPPSEHERDAVLAAVAAREGMTGVWSRDLSVDRCANELDPKRMWFGEVSYFWPPRPS